MSWTVPSPVNGQTHLSDAPVCDKWYSHAVATVAAGNLSIEVVDMANLITKRFSGCNRTEATRKARAFWDSEIRPTGVSWQEFTARCIAVGRGETIVFCQRDPRATISAP